MKQHKVPESNLAGTARQEPSTDLTSATDEVSAALADLAPECRLVLEQDAGSADGLLEEVRAALSAGADITHVAGLLSGAIGPSRQRGRSRTDRSKRQRSRSASGLSASSAGGCAPRVKPVTTSRQKVHNRRRAEHRLLATRLGAGLCAPDRPTPCRRSNARAGSRSHRAANAGNSKRKRG
jgi:hypothetical protein